MFDTHNYIALLYRTTSVSLPSILLMLLRSLGLLPDHWGLVRSLYRNFKSLVPLSNGESKTLNHLEHKNNAWETIPQVFGRVKVEGMIVQTIELDAGNYAFVVIIARGLVDTLHQVWVEDEAHLPSAFPITFYHGSQDQEGDSFLESVNGSYNVNYRGTCYCVINPFKPSKSTIPRFFFEVESLHLRREAVSICATVRDLCILPAWGEFHLHAQVHYFGSKGESRINECEYLDTNGDIQTTSFAQYFIDRARAHFAHLEWICIDIYWMLDSLDVSTAKLYPTTELNRMDVGPSQWSVSTWNMSNAKLSKKDECGNLIWGATPSDDSIISLINLCHEHSIKVMVCLRMVPELINKSCHDLMVSDVSLIGDFLDQYEMFVKHYIGLKTPDAICIACDLPGLLLAPQFRAKIVSLIKFAHDFTTSGYCANYDDASGEDIQDIYQASDFIGLDLIISRAVRPTWDHLKKHDKPIWILRFNYHDFGQDYNAVQITSRPSSVDALGLRHALSSSLQITSEDYLFADVDHVFLYGYSIVTSEQQSALPRQASLNDCLNKCVVQELIRYMLDLNGTQIITRPPYHFFYGLLCSDIDLTAIYNQIMSIYRLKVVIVGHELMLVNLADVDLSLLILIKQQDMRTDMIIVYNQNLRAMHIEFDNQNYQRDSVALGSTRTEVVRCDLILSSYDARQIYYPTHWGNSSSLNTCTFTLAFSALDEGILPRLMAGTLLQITDTNPSTDYLVIVTHVTYSMKGINVEGELMN